MKDQSGFALLVVIAIVALIGVAGVGSYVVVKQRAALNTISENSLVTTREEVSGTTEVRGEGVKGKISIKADATTVTDCGMADCFEKKFASCEPATASFDIGFGAVFYKILGPATGGCKMTMKYTKNPNPEWVNKDLTCTFDNKMKFETSVGEAFNAILEGKLVCEGPLYTILTNL